MHQAASRQLPSTNTKISSSSSISAQTLQEKTVDIETLLKKRVFRHDFSSCDELESAATEVNREHIMRLQQMALTDAPPVVEHEDIVHLSYKKFVIQYAQPKRPVVLNVGTSAALFVKSLNGTTTTNGCGESCSVYNILLPCSNDLLSRLGVQSPSPLQFHQQWPKVSIMPPLSFAPIIRDMHNTSERTDIVLISDDVVPGYEFMSGNSPRTQVLLEDSSDRNFNLGPSLTPSSSPLTTLRSPSTPIHHGVIGTPPRLPTSGDTPAQPLPRRHLHKLNFHTPSPHNPLPPDSYPHNNATNINVVYLASRNDYSSNPRSNHKQIILLNRNDNNLVQFGFFVDLKASGDSPYSQLQSGAIKSGKGSILTKLFTIPSNTIPPTSRILDGSPWVTIAIPTLLACLLSVVLATTIYAASSTYAFIACLTANRRGCACLLLCCVLTPLALAKMTLVRSRGLVVNNKYKTFISLTAWGMGSNQCLWLLSTLTPPIIALGLVVTLCTAAVGTIIFITSITANYMKKHSSYTILLIILIGLAACSTGHVERTTNHQPRPLPLPLLHFCRSLEPSSSSPSTNKSTPTPLTVSPYCKRIRHLSYMAIKLSPLLLLQPYQLALPALSLLPLSPVSLVLMGISQLPHVLATSETACSMTAAETLSTLVATAWANYVARLDTTEVDIGTEHTYTVTGKKDSHKNNFCIQTVNIQGGIQDADKIIAIQDVIRKYEPDAMAISEAGKHCKAPDLKWLNKNLDENTHNADQHLSNIGSDFPYTITSACTESPNERGGIVFLLHNKWRHRVVGKPIVDRNGRWICIDVRTPRGRTSLIAAYLPPSPQHSTPAKLAWANLQDFVISRHLKNRLVYLFGDLNASSNNPLHRNNTGSSHTAQDRLLQKLMDHGGLVDTFPVCNPDSQYKTWNNHNTWSSPDHILISSHTRHHATASQISNQTAKLHGLDHYLLTSYINVDGSADIPKEQRSHIHFDRTRCAEYTAELDKELALIPQNRNEEDNAHAFFTACIKVAKRIFTSTRRATPRSSKRVLSIKNDVNAINIALYHTREGTIIPQKIRKRSIFKDSDMSILSLTTMKSAKRAELNSKSRKRAALNRRLFTNRRSDHFTNGRLGPFLCSALSKYSTFRGVESIYNTITGAVTSNPDEVKQLTTERVSSTFYSQRIPEPAYVRFSTDDKAWLRMPAWYRKTFGNIKNSTINPALANSMRAVSPTELKAALSRLGKNKTGGPSHLTAEMLIFASESAQLQYILPFVNQCIKNKNTPLFTKNFNVWLIEKTKGVGPIMHPTNKLDVRPISLFEVSFKLVETILATRINDAMTPRLHPAQHAFNALRSVVDAITTYTLIMEDACQYKKEIHVSNNDCTQAYDAVPPWAMYAVYRYHGFPPDLIQMLINMDDNMQGRILTAHGAGSVWTKTCGLGQGSVLAPLKWNLFLDPLLHMMDTTSDPYVMTNGTQRIEIRVIAFADDTTIFASSHKGYLERMAMAGEFFGIFGVNFSPQKTNYTYANTRGRHYKSAPITVRKPDGTTNTQPSSVTSPHKPLRYLGAWLSPTLNWLPAKRKLRDEVTKILSILRHKTLSPEEYKYTIQSVLHSKLRYYLAVVPLLDSELDDIDRRIAHIMKKRMHLAQSCSSPLLFLPETEYGGELPSIKDTRATALITTAHSLLNDNHSILGSIARMRLSHLQESLGWGENPLSNPHLIPHNTWNKHWCARIGIILGRHGASISDTRGALTTKGKRPRDTSLHTLLPTQAYAAAKNSLKKHGLRWLGQLTNPQGTKLISRTNTRNHVTSHWWKILSSHAAEENGNLKHPISPTPSPITRFVPTHNPGTVATTYSLNQTTDVWEHQYYKITDSHIGNDGRESCYVTQLYPCTTKLLSLCTGVRNRKILHTQGTPFFKGDNDTVEFADALHPVPCTWARVNPYDKYPLDIALIHDSCTISTKHTTIMGTTNQKNLADIAQTVRDSTCTQTGEYRSPPAPHTRVCHICDLPEADISCRSTSCTHAVHLGCTDKQDWKCEECQPELTTVKQLHPSHRMKLERRALTHTIYSASDGSVKYAGTERASSTFGIVIDHNHTNVRRCGKIEIRKGEESSLRVELEALIHAYNLIPQNVPTIHAADNETAIAIHNELAASGLPPQRALVLLPYHSTIVRLHKAMQRRSRFLTVIHTLSHLEHESTDDKDLYLRRQSLARADTQAEEGHHVSAFIIDPSGVEDFALRINGVIVEKKASSPFAQIQSKKRMEQLYFRALEGANHRTGPSPAWRTGSRQWPSFLRKFRHKLITQRLPTAQNRVRRGDSEDGVLVNPWCPLCLAEGTFVQETHSHLLTCPCSARAHTTLLRDINNICKPYYTPRPLLAEMDNWDECDLLDNMNLQHSHTAAWTSHTTDKHGRKTPMSSGPPGRQYGATKRLTSWAHNILRHCVDNIQPQDHKKYIDSTKPFASLDPHLLQGIAHAINATTIHDAIPHNPFIPTPTLHIHAPPRGDLPTVINVSGNDVDWEDISTHLTDARPWVLIADDDQLISVEKHTPSLLLTTIPPGNIALWNRSFWEGQSGLFPEAIDSSTTIFISPAVTELQRTAILDTVHMRCTKGGNLSPRPNIQTQTLTQETPPSISSLLAAPHHSAAKLQLLSGYISKEITDSWEGIIPARLHQKLYRALHKTITLHQHGVWIHRNNILHPQAEVYIPIDYGRKPTHKRELPEEEEPNPLDKQWKRQRKAGLTRQRMWAGTPIPKSTPKRKRSHTEDSGAEEALNQHKTRTSIINNPHTDRDTSDEERPRMKPATSTKRKRTEVSIRKPSRPRKQRHTTTTQRRSISEFFILTISDDELPILTTPDGEADYTHTVTSTITTPHCSAETPDSRPKRTRPIDEHRPTRSVERPRLEPALSAKRKRQAEVSIRKPSRPLKQRQRTAPFQRRSISELITHIRHTRLNLLTQNSSNPTQINRVSRERGGEGEGASGPVGLGGSSDCDVEDRSPQLRTRTTLRTQHNTPLEPQRITLTPPPRPLDGRLGEGHRRIRHTISHTSQFTTPHQ